MAFEIPSSCTLPSVDRPLRLAEFDELLHQAVRAERLSPTALRVVLEGDAGLEPRVRDLAERESSCCSFFSFDVTAREHGGVQLRIEVPAQHASILDSLHARAGTSA